MSTFHLTPKQDSKRKKITNEKRGVDYSKRYSLPTGRRVNTNSKLTIK